jgi:5'-nucleotidase
MENQSENIALFDMDGTLCDYDFKLRRDLKALSSPSEPKLKMNDFHNLPRYLRKRAELITSREQWWASLPRFKLGWDVLSVTQKYGFRTVILTQGPRKNKNAWSGKKEWIDENLGQDADMIITRDKSLVYGKILVDDWPEYIEGWLENRPRGLVIMPAHKYNENFKHANVIRYDGTNMDQVARAIKAVKERKSGETLNL